MYISLLQNGETGDKINPNFKKERYYDTFGRGRPTYSGRFRKCITNF
jgi:hypothetical protein